MERILSKISRVSFVIIIAILLNSFPVVVFGASAKILSIKNLNITVNQNQKYALPRTVAAVMSDKTTKSVSVTWDRSIVTTSKIGKFTYKGTVRGYTARVLLTLNVVAPKDSNTATANASVVKTVEQYEAVLKNALENFLDTVEITIEGYDERKYSLDVIGEILDKNPTLNYGYTGSRLSSYYYGDGKVRNVKITLLYKKNKSEMENMKKLASQKASQILAKLVKEGMTDLEIELAIHDYIINNAEYNIEGYNTNSLPAENFTDYGVLVLGKGVCEGYAKAMFRLLNQAGIECLYVTGTADGIGHAWNIVKIAGKYYHVDATFDDPVSRSGEDILSHDYFNKSDKEFSKDHIWIRGNYPKCD